MNDNIIEMRDIYKIFPNGTVANKGVNLEVKKGEIHALVGENGAGKSTLMKILFGLEQATSGSVLIDGKEAKVKNPRDAMTFGLGMVHQEFMLVPSFTAAVNVALGREKTKGIFCDRAAEREKMQRIAEGFGLKIDFDRQVSKLSVGIKQRIEILKALYNNADIIILDEPTAVLTPQETDELFTSLKMLISTGRSIVFITHKIQEVIAISDRVTVLRNGESIKTMNTADTTREEISHLMMGRDLGKPIARRDTGEGETVFEAHGLNVLNTQRLHAVKNISFEVKSGEIFGIAGVEGNGQVELISAITGLNKPVSGEMLYKGKSISGQNSVQFRKLGVGYIPEDRGVMGASLETSIEENLILNVANERRFKKGVLLDKQAIRNYSEKLIKKFGVKTSDVNLPAKSMSGGNIQKMIVAREISENPDFIIACQPTRGVDISSIEYIHNELLAQRNNGVGVLLITTELTEILALSDRIGVIYNGELVAVLNNDGEIDEEELGFYMLGLKRGESAQEIKRERR